MDRLWQYLEVRRHHNKYFKKYPWWGGGAEWLSRLSVRLLVSAQVMISRFHEFEPHIGLCADGAEPACDFLSPSLSASFSLHLSK